MILARNCNLNTHDKKMETAHTGAALALLDMRFGENQHEHDSLSLGSPISEHYDDREKVCFVLFRFKKFYCLFYCHD